MKVDLKTYNRSTHNLSSAWRSPMGVGTLVPFMKILGLPGDTFEIDLDTRIMTHPTVGPLFGNFKFQQMSSHVLSDYIMQCCTTTHLISD